MSSEEFFELMDKVIDFTILLSGIGIAVLLYLGVIQ